MLCPRSEADLQCCQDVWSAPALVASEPLGLGRPDPSIPPLHSVTTLNAAETDDEATCDVGTSFAVSQEDPHRSGPEPIIVAPATAFASSATVILKGKARHAAGLHHAQTSFSAACEEA